METISSAPPTQAAIPSDARRMRGFALAAVMVALLLTVLLEALDQTVVGTALPKIIGTLHGFDRYTWIVTAYLLASAAVTPIAGKLSDQFGRKWFLIGGAALFLLSSFLSGAAQTMNQLIAFRALQGLGAGIGIALAMTVVGDLFPPAERAKWQGIIASAYGLSNLLGPALGGWLADHGPLVGSLVTNDSRWRWVFYINLPVGLLALAALFIYLPANISARSSEHTGWAAVRRIDAFGAVLAAGATVCLLLGLTWGSDQSYAWNSPQVISTLVVAAVLYVAFFVTERFAVEPVLPLGLFRNQTFAADGVLTLVSGMAMLPLFLYLPLFLQGVLGESATNSGLITTPMSVSVVIGAGLAMGVITKFQRYQLATILGGCLFVVGVFLLARMTPTTNLFDAGRDMVIAGIGLGTFFAVQTVVAQNAVSREQLGVATSAVRYLQALGSTLGAAIVGTAVNNALSTELARRIPASMAQRMTPAGLKAATNPQVLVNPDYHASIVHTAQQFAVTAATRNIPSGPIHDAIARQVSAQTATMLQQVFDALRQSLAVAIQRGFVVTLALCVVCLLVTFFLKDVPFKPETPSTPNASAEPEAEAR